MFETFSIFDRIFEEQINLINSIRPDVIENTRLDVADILKEFRTVSMNSPRQTGLTQWVADQVSQSRNRLVVFKNSRIRDHFIQNTKSTPEDTLLFQKDFINNDERSFALINFIYVDDSRSYEKVELQLLYKWVSDNCADNVIVVLCK